MTGPIRRSEARLDDRTHLTHRVEHVVDMETGAIVAVTLYGADEGETATFKERWPSR